MLPVVKGAAAEERWPRRDDDSEFDAEMAAAGFRIPTRPLDRPRVVVKPRPGWLAFLLRLAGRETLPFERIELRPLRDRDPELDAVLQAMGVRVATYSLDRPRYVARQRPAWLAFIVRALRRLR